MILRAEIIWDKLNGLPESARDRVHRRHEQWFHLVRGDCRANGNKGRYYQAIDEIRVPHTGGSNPGRKDGEAPPDGKLARQVESGQRGGTTKGTDPALFNPLGRIPGSVWGIATEPLEVPEHLAVDHFAAFPQEWPRRFILGWSPPAICLACGEGRRPDTETDNGVKERKVPAYSPNGDTNHGNPGSTLGSRGPTATIIGYVCDCPTPSAPTRPAVVLDPFVGTGTTVMVARTLGRYGVGLDLSADYLRLARWRVFDSGHAAKTTARTNRERQGTLL